MLRIQNHFVFILGFSTLASICFSQMPRQVRVTVDFANVRVKPSPDAEILDIVGRGTIYDVVEKTGAWYSIIFSVSQSGQITYGFVHESTVAPVEGPAPKPPLAEHTQETPPPPAPVIGEKPPAPPQELPREQNRVRPDDKAISGSFVKFGFGDHWLASFGFDYGLGRNLGLGLEIQPYYEGHSEVDLSVLQLDVFLNAKLGFRVAFLKIYGGGGVGPDFSIAMMDVGGESFSTFRTKMAYHLIAGTELDLKIIGILFEFQVVQIPNRGTAPDERAYFLLAGLRF